MASPEEKLAELQRYVEENRRRLDTGEELNLKGLDNIVGDLCKDILALPPSESQKYVKDMQTLLAALNNLQTQLISKQGNMQQQLHGLNLQKKAAHAYQSTNTLGKPANTSEKEDK